MFQPIKYLIHISELSLPLNLLSISLLMFHCLPSIFVIRVRINLIFECAFLLIIHIIFILNYLEIHFWFSLYYSLNQKYSVEWISLSLLSNILRAYFKGIEKLWKESYRCLLGHLLFFKEKFWMRQMVFTVLWGRNDIFFYR